MNRINHLFETNQENILSVYLTAGFPALNDLPVLLEALQESGVDMVEIGIPFSDPLADGPVIQASSQRALQNGMSLSLLFTQLEGIRNRIRIPLVLMGYLNPVLRMGMQSFLENCNRVGIDGVILPDLPLEEYEANFRDQFVDAGIHNCMLITPHTDPDRIQKISGLSEGFLYMVADSATTGARSSLSEKQLSYFKRISAMDLPLPGLIGFGISSYETFQTACNYARGAIIGSAFIRALEEPGDLALKDKVARFVEGIREGS